MPVMFRSWRWRLLSSDRGGRFAAGVVGAVLASVVWLVVVVLTSTTPGEARDRRAAPQLPPPTAALTTTMLRQVTWYGCARDRVTIQVEAPVPPAGRRSVVTTLARAGTAARTGTKLATIAGEPLIAVVTHGAFYRDLTVGDHGSDVRSLERAIEKAGLIPRADDVLDAGSVRGWRARFDPDSPADRIRLSTVVAVPPGSSVNSATTPVGQTIEPGSVLLDVQSSSTTFTCDVPDPAGAITPTNVAFEVDGSAVEVDTLVARKRDAEGPGHVDVEPGSVVDADQGRLGIESSRSDGPVLAAPLSAVTTDAEGNQAVVVVGDDGRREVRVSLGSTAQGLVEVRGAGLTDGVQVVLFDARAPGEQEVPGGTRAPRSAPSP
ncbi:MAG: peptidoglycan binding domain 1 [Aeromicrobium sp.]|jgi:hypothetical protein|nr:peptidoglycan binding domain 1 [Aeromicrobium sp.]